MGSDSIMLSIRNTIITGVLIHISGYIMNRNDGNAYRKEVVVAIKVKSKTTTIQVNVNDEITTKATVKTSA